MTNKIFLEQMKNLYDSLKYFEIHEQFLMLKLEKNFVCPLNYTNLANLNPSLFILTPNEIFQIIYSLELLHKNELSSGEITFITQYTEKYLKLNDLARNGEQIDANRLWNLSLPINFAYDEQYINTDAGKLITSIVDKYSIESENSLGKNPRLVLIKGENPNFEWEEDIDKYKPLKDAGFATIILIITTIIITCGYIIFYIISK